MSVQSAGSAAIREEIATALEETRRAYHAILAGLSPEAWRYTSHVPEWTNGEMLFHVAFVLNAIPSEASLIRRGIPFPTPPAALFDWLQERLVRKGAARHNVQSVAAFYDQGHQRVLRVLALVEDHQWRRSVRYPCVDPPYLCGKTTVEELFRYGVYHFEQHRSHVRHEHLDLEGTTSSEERSMSASRETGIMVYPAGGWRKWMFRAPIPLWRLGFGRIIGHVLMLITHTGRKSGLPRRTPVEYYRLDGKPYVVCAWGEKSQWGRNLLADPRVTIQTAAGNEPAVAVRVTNDVELRRVYDLFMRRDPILTRMYMDMLNIEHDPQALVAAKDKVHIFRFDPTDEPAPPPLPEDLLWLWLLIPLGLLLIRWRDRRHAGRR